MLKPYSNMKTVNFYYGTQTKFARYIFFIYLYNTNFYSTNFDFVIKNFYYEKV